MTLISQTIQATVTTALFALWSFPTPEPVLEGQATYMRPGLMAQVAANKSLDLTPYAGAVALNRAGDLGRVAWLQWPATKTRPELVEGPFLVIDCAQRGQHFAKREHQHRIAEVSYNLATLHGFAGVGPAPVTVWFHKPPAARSPSP